MAHNREQVKFDISDQLFGVYLNFVRHLKASVGGTVNLRFSGGDPMVLGRRLFELADRASRVAGIKPFTLSAGKALSEKWVRQASRSSLSHAVFSVENPVSPDPGAPDPNKLVSLVRDLNSEEFPLTLGVCVVPNDCFKHLYEICAWFFERTGMIPSIAEINYGAYLPPTEEQWCDLESNIKRVVKDFARITPLSLFGSVSPELTFGGKEAYICDLDIENSYGLTEDNAESKIDDLLFKLSRINYPPVMCEARECTWWDNCDNTKWYWHDDGVTPPNKKIEAYCRFKRLLNDAFYSTLIDPDHPRTAAEIRVASRRKIYLQNA